MTNTHKNMRGFEYMIYSAFSLSLVCILMFLPLAPIFASEEVVSQDSEMSSDNENSDEADVAKSEADSDSTNESEESTSNEQMDLDLQEDTRDENLIVENSEEELTEGSVDVVENHGGGTVIIESVEEVEIPEVSSGGTFQSGDDGIASEEVIDELSESDLVTSTPESVPIDENTETKVEDMTELVTEENSDEKSDSSDSQSNEELPDAVASTSSLHEEDPNFVNEVTNDKNRFSFATDECTLVGDGTLYCAKATGAPVVEYTDRVFSAVDIDGDKEIYIEKNGELTQITFNTSDDDAPYFDETSETIVWHRLIDGRYQIINFDIDSGEETQITFDRYNNMQPSRFGDITVWQGWVGDDWEVFQLVGDELVMLTDNTVHDISPHMNGTHIIWQSFESDAWVMKVYDIRTHSIETVEGGDGGSIENPRFVLVYDTKYESGDIQTRGYDLESGEILELAAKPAPVPNEIPNPEQTGEERALVAPTVQPKSKVGLDNEDDDTSDTSSEEGGEFDDIVIPPFSEVNNTDIASSTNEEIYTHDEYEISIPAIVPDVTEVHSQASSTHEIQDLIITPFVEEIEENDSQELVVTEA